MTQLEFYKTKVGLLHQVYASQLYRSKLRGHTPPLYTRDELVLTITSMPLYDKLFTAWVKSGYLTKLKPSIDRLDDTIGYTPDNIQLVTWEQNNNKAKQHQRLGILNTAKPLKQVIQYTLDNIFIQSFISSQEASRVTGVNQRNISQVCIGKRITAGGYIWRHVDE
jgi:hypothetical protein